MTHVLVLYLRITGTWPRFCGHEGGREPYDWGIKHYVQIGRDAAHHCYLVMDIEMNERVDFGQPVQQVRATRGLHERAGCAVLTPGQVLSTECFAIYED